MANWPGQESIGLIVGTCSFPTIVPAGQHCAGFTTFNKVVDDISQLDTSYIGVRRGIATALKLRSIHVAEQMGTRQIQTNHKANNPKFHLNLQLGFESQPVDVDWEKKL